MYTEQFPEPRDFTEEVTNAALALSHQLAKLDRMDKRSFGDLLSARKEHGKNDLRSGSEYTSKCPPNDSLSWCSGYKVGYEAGWGAAGVLEGK